MVYYHYTISGDLYISVRSPSIEIKATEFLKNISSIEVELIDFRAGSMRSSLPNLKGWDGYAVAMYLLRVS